MRTLLLLALFALSGAASATTNNESGPGPIQDHTCQGGHNCNDIGHGTITGGDSSADASAAAAASASAAAVSGSTSSASADSTNVNLNVSEGGNAYASGGDAKQSQSINDSGNSSSVAFGGSGGDAEQSQGQVQGQHQSSDNSNSSNNSSSQSTNVVFEGTGKADHYNRHGNNVNAYAPAIYSSSACTGGGLSAGASAMGMGLALGGAKQDKQCQVRENARILSGLDTNLAILYLCANPLVDIGAVLGSACKPAPAPEPPVIVVPEEPKQPETPVEVVTDTVHGK